MGGEWAEQRKLLKFLLCMHNRANRAGNVHQLCTGISP